MICRVGERKSSDHPRASQLRDVELAKKQELRTQLFEAK